MSQGKKNKRNGTAAEYKVVKEAEKFGLKAQRAWCSDGRSLGLAEGVDVVVDDIPLQVKRREKVAAYLDIPEGTSGVVLHQPHQPLRVVLPFSEWLLLRTLLGTDG